MSESLREGAVIRRATRGDMAEVEAIVVEAYSHYVARIGRKPGPMLDDYAALVGEGSVHVLGAERRLQGLVVLVREPGVMLLDNVAVRPAAQGRGFGRLLLDFAEKSALEAGLPALRLYTHEMMTENIALYRRNGYVETHRGEEHGLRRVYMLKSL